MENWYLIYTKPKCEDMVEGKLIGAGFTVLNAKVRERKFLRGKVMDAVSPLFPSYVFAKFEKFRDYHLIRYTRGVKWVLSSEEGPSEIPDRVVDSIVERIEDGFVKIRSSFTQGQNVIIKGGPFEGFTAVFEKEMSGMERVCLLLKAINVRLVIDRSMIAGC
ncbi:Transcription antitermination protein RfaH [uncultured bacterium]|nr:Transcription antitermination protein RfaH [uncultured bacterium]